MQVQKTNGIEVVQHQVNRFPGLESLPDEVTLPGLAEPNDFCEKKDPDVYFPLEAFRTLAGFLVSSVSHGLLFVGPTGAGKSYLQRQFLAYLNRPVFFVSGHRTLEWEDLIGTKEIVGGDTLTMDGPLVQAFQMPYSTFIFEEIDRARSDVTVSLIPVLDGQPIVHTLDNGRRIDRAEGVNIMATANTAGQGDLTGDYNSANVMDTAVLRRFWCHQHWYVSPDQEFEIVRRSVHEQVPDAQIHQAIRLANDVRFLHTGRDNEASPEAQSAGVGNAIHTTISTDSLIQLFHIMCIFPDMPNPVGHALNLIVTNKCTQECAEAIHRLADAHFAGDV